MAQTAAASQAADKQADKAPPAGVTVFGRFLIRKKITYRQAAKELEITRQYVGMLARRDLNHRGKRHRPSRDLEKRIEDWAKSKGGSVPRRSWEDDGAAA